MWKFLSSPKKRMLFSWRMNENLYVLVHHRFVVERFERLHERASGQPGETLTENLAQTAQKPSLIEPQQ
jgi:hypothetical protein